MANANIYDMADTWNDAGTTFTAIKMNVADTASASGSLLMDLQVDDVSQFSVGKKKFTLLAKSGQNGFTFDASNLVNNDNSLRIISNGGSNWQFDTVNGFISVRGFAMGSVGGPDIAIVRDAADALAQRRGTNAQTTRGYRTFTDASNYERWALQSGAGYFEWAAETAGTGTDTIDLRLTPAGTGLVQFGTHAEIAAETVTGYITIKDAAGNSRKLAVVS